MLEIENISSWLAMSVGNIYLCTVYITFAISYIFPLVPSPTLADQASGDGSDGNGSDGSDFSTPLIAVVALIAVFFLVIIVLIIAIVVMCRRKPEGRVDFKPKGEVCMWNHPSSLLSTLCW